MKISFNSALYQYSKNNRFTASKNTNPIAFSQSVSDTVSFGKIKSYPETVLDELSTEYENKLVPFINDNKEIFLTIGLIGAKAQETVDAGNIESERYTNSMFRLMNNANNPYLKNTLKYISRAQTYENNNKEFERIKEYAELPMYMTSDKLKEEIQKTSIIFDECNEVKKLIPLYDYWKTAEDNARNAISYNGIKSLNPEFYEKLNNALNVKNGALYWLIVFPYNDAVNIGVDIKQTKDNLNVPKKIWYEDEKKVNNLSYRMKNLLEIVSNYSELKTDAENFVELNKDTKFPSQTEIRENYNALMECNKKILADNYSGIDKFFKENYTDKAVDININLVDRETKVQNTAIRNLHALISKIKQEYIARENEKILNGYMSC